MVKEVIWSDQAIIDRKDILSYWIERNQSNVYSLKLDELFREAVKLISEYPFIGKVTDIKNIRAKIVRDYYIFYEETENKIHVLSIWDTRRNPVKIKKKLRKK